MSHGIGPAAPVFPVANLQSSIDYYVNRLGFKVDWEHAGTFASVSREKCCLFICVGDQGNPGVWVWIGVPDVDVLYKEFCDKEAIIRSLPANFSWAWEMQVEDLDGNVLRFGSEPKEGVPFGSWRDMNGDLWEGTAEGGWKKQ